MISAAAKAAKAAAKQTDPHVAKKWMQNMKDAQLKPTARQYTDLIRYAENLDSAEPLQRS